MYGIIESLNLGTSSGIVLYEITKQRRAFQFDLKKKIAAKKAEKITKYDNSSRPLSRSAALRAIRQGEK
jgi:hypothetical protein